MAGMFGATPRNDLLKALYFTPPPKNEQYWRGKTLGSISKPQRSTQQTLGNLLANALTPVSGERRARHVANRAVNALTDLTPVGGAVAAEDARRDWNQGNTLGAVFNGAMAALSALPGGGAELKSIIAPLWHGSPHKFEKFALDKIGTGEGAQAYGHGLYFAENPVVAQQYADEVKNMGPVREINSRLSELAREMEPLTISYGKFRDPRGYELSAEYDRLMDERAAISSAPGNMYEVRLDANPEDFLDWDTPLGAQPGIADRYRSLGIPLVDAWVQNGALPHIKGETAYRQIAGGLTRGAAEKGLHATASQKLKDAGIPGIRYLDQLSRGTDRGTRNYVVFDDSIIDILGRK